MVAAVPYATRGHFCTTQPGAAVARATWGRFCDVDVEIPLVRGGGGGGPSMGLPGENYYNQAPPKYRDPKQYYLEIARQEDEELIMLIKAFAEVIQWH